MNFQTFFGKFIFLFSTSYVLQFANLQETRVIKVLSLLLENIAEVQVVIPWNYSLNPSSDSELDLDKIFSVVMNKHKPFEVQDYTNNLLSGNRNRVAKYHSFPFPLSQSKGEVYWIILIQKPDNIENFVSFMDINLRLINRVRMIFISPPGIEEVTFDIGYLIKNAVHISETFTKTYCTFCSFNVGSKWRFIDEPEAGSIVKFDAFRKNYNWHCFAYPLPKLKPMQWRNFTLFHQLAMSVEAHRKPETFNVASLLPSPRALVPQYLLKKYNGSFASCQEVDNIRIQKNITDGPGIWNYYIKYFLTIDFKITVFSHKRKANKEGNVVSPGMAVHTKFITPQIISRRKFWLSLLGPLGFEVFCSIILLIPIMIGVSYLATRFTVSKSPPSFGDLTSAIIRPLLDQCMEDQIFPFSYFRLILSGWLLYCLIVSETYRGELKSHLMAPADPVYLKTFRELSLTGWKKKIPLVIFNPVEHVKKDIREALSDANETEWEQLGKKKNSFHYLQRRIKWYENKTDFNIVENFFRGKLHIIDHEETLKMILNTYEADYGSPFYRISDDELVNEELWKMIAGPLEYELARDINWCRDTGIISHLSRHYRILSDVAEKEALRTSWFANYTGKIKPAALAEGPHKLEVRHFEAVFGILAFSCTLSFLALLIEICFWKCKNKGWNCPSCDINGCNRMKNDDAVYFNNVIRIQVLP